jgi:hypothetical protein
VRVVRSLRVKEPLEVTLLPPKSRVKSAAVDRT